MHLSRLLATAVLAAAAVLASKRDDEKPAPPAAKIVLVGARDAIPVEARIPKALNNYPPARKLMPRATVFGSGATCADAFGAGNIPCGTGSNCYDPTAGETCCSTGNYCKAGKQCLADGTCTNSPLTCGQTIGPGYVQCGTGSVCYNPAAGESCCTNGYACSVGQSCSASGTSCISNSGGTFQSPVPSPRPKPSPKPKKLSTGAIAGIAIGGLAILALILALVFVLLRRRKQNPSPPVASAGMQQAEHIHVAAGKGAEGGYYNPAPPVAAQDVKGPVGPAPGYPGGGYVPQKPSEGAAYYPPPGQGMQQGMQQGNDDHIRYSVPPSYDGTIRVEADGGMVPMKRG